MEHPRQVKLSRRDFLGATAATGLVIIHAGAVRGTEANSAVRLALLGCGGRGTWVMTSFLNNTPTRLVALADLLPDQLERARKHFDELGAAMASSPIDRRQLFGGPDSARRLMDSAQVDAVIVATPPYYHPEHFEAAVDGGKHVYLEKPVAVDVAGCARVQEAGKRGRGKISMDVGFQVRYSPPYAEMVRRIHSGALGKIGFGQAYFYTGAGRRPDWPNATLAEKRLRNWHYDRVLSGDILVEQGVHLVDVCNWALGSLPVSATGGGGRIVRDDPGDVWDHYAVTFQYPGNVLVSFSSTQFVKGWWDACVRLLGGRGVAECHYVGGVRIYGEEPWDSGFGRDPKAGVFEDALKDADPEKEKAFIQSITSGRLHDETQQGTAATLSAILGRTAAYAKREITWDEMIASNEAWDPKIDLQGLRRD